MPGATAGGGQMSLSSMPPTAMGVFTDAGALAAVATRS